MSQKITCTNINMKDAFKQANAYFFTGQTSLLIKVMPYCSCVGTMR